MSIILLLLIAVLPGLAIGNFIYLKDRKEPEPYGLLLISVFYGVVAFFISQGIGYLLHNFMFAREGDMTRKVLNAFLLIGLLSEGFKFLFLRGFTFYYKNFNQPFDGIVYSIMVGIGFATTENVLHIMSADSHTAILPLLTSVPANAVFAVIMGFFLGEAKLFRNRTLIYSLLALLLAAIAHGSYDYLFYLSGITGLWKQAIVSLVVVVLLVQLALKLRKNTVFKEN